VGVVVLVQDISEQERLEQMRKDFIANVSHEFRTPLTLIKGSLEALIDGAVPDNDITEFYKGLLNETNRLQRMVNDLLDLSKLQSGKVNLSFEELDLTTLISDVSRTMQFIAGKKNIKIQLNITQIMPPVWGDYDKLKQLLIIFIDNAIKYSYEKSTILISTEVKDYAYIEIKDSGIGIPKEEIPYIWDRFYKVDKSRNGSKTGTGLGLAIAKYLIELLNSTINIESEPDKGTRIRIGLPLTLEGTI
jgi:signal transduction histidine kinase